MNPFRKKAEAFVSKTSSKPQPVAGRERLQHFDGELVKAHTAVEDLLRRVAILEGIGADAAAADTALNCYIAADGGIDALTAHSAGRSKPDDKIAVLIRAAKASAEAAAPAKVALPLAQNQLEQARSEVFRLQSLRSEEVGRVMTRLVDIAGAEYKRTFEKLCEIHDYLAGFAAVASNNDGEILMISEEMRTPRFNLPSMACANDYDVFLRRRGNSYAVDQSAKVWAAVRERLESDVDADLSDLVGK